MEKKQIKFYAGLLLTFLLGLSILLYPTISNQWNKYRDSKLISSYTDSVKAKTGDDKIRQIWKAAEAYNRQIEQESVPDAFSVRDGVTDESYEALLNVNGDGMMGYIEIPAIDVNIPIYHYTTEEVLQKGAGHLFGSSLPIGGEGTHCVISAHRGLPREKLFTDLNLLEEGNVFYLHVLDQTLAYEVDQILTVLPEQTESLGITAGEDYVTLVTCTPYAVNTNRLLVRGHRIDYKEAKEAEKGEGKVQGIQNPNFIIMLLCVVLGIGIAILIVMMITHLKERR